MTTVISDTSVQGDEEEASMTPYERARVEHPGDDAPALSNASPSNGSASVGLARVSVETMPSVEEAEAAVRTLLRWIGEDPAREGLRETPSRVVRAYREHFAGYEEDPTEFLRKTFEEVEEYGEIVLLRDIRIESFCEHHMLPIIGKVHVAYVPDGKVVGISKLARVVEAFAKRLQIQEKLTAQIADAINDVLRPKGVAVIVDAEHHCMTTRGVRKAGVSMVTKRLIGCFRDDVDMRREFLSLIGHD